MCTLAFPFPLSVRSPSPRAIPSTLARQTSVQGNRMERACTVAPYPVSTGVGLRNTIRAAPGLHHVGCRCRRGGVVWCGVVCRAVPTRSAAVAPDRALPRMRRRARARSLPHVMSTVVCHAFDNQPAAAAVRAWRVASTRVSLSFSRSRGPLLPRRPDGRYALAIVFIPCDLDVSSSRSLVEDAEIVSRRLVRYGSKDGGVQCGPFPTVIHVGEVNCCCLMVSNVVRRDGRVMESGNVENQGS